MQQSFTLPSGPRTVREALELIDVALEGDPIRPVLLKRLDDGADCDWLETLLGLLRRRACAASSAEIIFCSAISPST